MDDQYIDTWGITRTDLLVQDLQTQIAAINPVIYNDSTFTGTNNTYHLATGGVTNVTSSNSTFNITGTETIVTGSNIDINTITSTSTYFQYSPFYNSIINNLSATSNLYIYGGNTLSNLYASMETNITSSYVSNIYLSSNLTISGNSTIEQINIANANVINYATSNTYVTSMTASNVYTDYLSASNIISSTIYGSNVLVTGSNVFNQFDATYAATQGGYFKNFDVANNAYITYNPRVAIAATTVSFFFDTDAIPPNTTTYKLLSYMFDQNAHLYVTYLDGQNQITYMHTLFRL